MNGEVTFTLKIDHAQDDRVYELEPVDATLALTDGGTDTD